MEINWFHDEKHILADNKYEMVDQERTLIINDIDANDGGVYCCQVNGTYGENEGYRLKVHSM